MSNKLLHRLDIEIHPRPYIALDDSCSYFLEKESEGYSKSDANNIIYNFKKPINRKGMDDWKYKEKAICQLSDMLNHIKFPKCILIPAPTSNPRNTANWDDRLDQCVDSITQQDVVVVKALDVATSQTPAHLGGSRNIESIKKATSLSDLAEYADYDTVVILDDVLTTGAHFKAWKEMILDDNPNIKKVYGVFFALHLWKDIEVDEIEF